MSLFLAICAVGVILACFARAVVVNARLRNLDDDARLGDDLSRQFSLPAVALTRVDWGQYMLQTPFWHTEIHYENSDIAIERELGGPPREH